MIISNSVTTIPTTDVHHFSWSNLRRFSNFNSVSAKIIERFSLPKKQHGNARKQSEQISFCLSQAKEYFDAAGNASLATRPVQLYYGCMALALAQILWKGDGTHSLDKLRNTDGRHGLILVRDPASGLSGTKLAQLISAKVDTRGTFPVWKKLCRNFPLVGITKTLHNNGTGESGPRVIYSPDDSDGLPYPSEGITLLDCAKNLPTLHSTIIPFGEVSELVRATLEREVLVDQSPQRINDTITVHPYPNEKIDAVKSAFGFKGNLHERLLLTEFRSGFQLKFWIESDDLPASLRIPEGTSLNSKFTYLRPVSSVLNEFGYFYVALYIGGMYSRYYPDLWVRQLTEHSELSLIIEQICTEAIARLPLLTLCELDQMIYIAE